MDNPLVNNDYRLNRMPGKGGWTFISIEEIPKNIPRSAGMLRVRGSIDAYQISDTNLMPMKNGNLFLPIKSEIRKKIGKQDGDTVHLILYPDKSPLHIPEELLLCLYDEPAALDFFNKLADNEKRNFIIYMFSAKKMETRANRIARCMNKMVRGLRMYDSE